ncbi:MAG: hypothetical protein JSU69_02845, partial [Candidatus Zixiibacteriota bacterium]
TGQNGLLLNSQVGSASGVVYEFDISLYGKDEFRNFAKLLTSLEIPVNDYSVFGFSFSNSREKNMTDVRNESEYRLEYRVRKESLHLRSYFGHTDDKYGNHYISCFARMRNDVESLGRIELWVNFDKINYSAGRVDYLYSYIREITDVTSSLEMSAKMSYRYSRSDSKHEQLKFWLEAKLKW